MNSVFLNSMYFILPLVIAGLMLKYVFKGNTAILVPSVLMLLLFILVTIGAQFTPMKSETDLFTFFCVLQVVVLAGGILLMSRQEIVWKHFFISLPFQFFYWVQLFYYGGLQFTHKFGA